MKHLIFIFLLLGTWACGVETSVKEGGAESLEQDPYLVVLGTAQDAGYPQAGCQKSCCTRVRNMPGHRGWVSSLALVDPLSQERWIFDATPSFPDQLAVLDSLAPFPLLNGIFLTHAHIGHYTGLMHLGREAMGAQEVPVFAMPKMRYFLASNGPWSQLVQLRNIRIHNLQQDSAIILNERISVQPFLVPHRDEFSETVGYKIIGPNKTAIFIPDIDKWEKWERNIRQEIHTADLAFLDGSFFKNGEIPGRDMALIPHPFIEESLHLFSTLSDKDKQKVHFIHFNHTNPVLDPQSLASRQVLSEGFHIAYELQMEKL